MKFQRQLDIEIKEAKNVQTICNAMYCIKRANR